MGFSLSRLLWREPDYDESEDADAESESGGSEEDSLPIVLEVEALAPLQRYPRMLPSNVESAATATVMQMQRTQLTLDDNDAHVLVLRLPPPRGGRKPGTVKRWPLVNDMDALRSGVHALMAEDGLVRISSAHELCARYPGYYWNLVFHLQSRTSVFDFIQDVFGQK
jgi:hypothetical protein